MKNKNNFRFADSQNAPGVTCSSRRVRFWDFFMLRRRLGNAVLRYFSRARCAAQ